MFDYCGPFSDRFDLIAVLVLQFAAVLNPELHTCLSGAGQAQGKQGLGKTVGAG